MGDVVDGGTGHDAGGEECPDADELDCREQKTRLGLLHRVHHGGHRQRRRLLHLLGHHGRAKLARTRKKKHDSISSFSNTSSLGVLE